MDKEEFLQKIKDVLGNPKHIIVSITDHYGVLGVIESYSVYINKIIFEYIEPFLKEKEEYKNKYMVVISLGGQYLRSIMDKNYPYEYNEIKIVFPSDVSYEKNFEIILPYLKELPSKLWPDGVEKDYEEIHNLIERHRTS